MATIVIGLDGGNWPLVEPWLEAGALPNLAALRDGGTWGVSESVLPPVTCPNWKCYATSRSPGAHDIYWWEQVDKETGTIQVPDSTSFTAPELWDYLNDEGYSTGVMNLPMSYPPRSVDGVMVAGGPRSRETGYTHPAELETTLRDEFDYSVHPENVVTSDSDQRGVEATLDLIRTRFEAALSLLESRNLDFLHLTVFHLNVLQHFYWDEPPVRQAWELVDEYLGRFVDRGDTIFLMSDHGCDEIDRVFYINEWLREEGHLAMDSTIADYLMSVGLTQERLAALVRLFNLEPTLRKYLPRRLIERFPDEEGIKRDNKFEKLDVARSSAIASGQGLIYVLEPPESDEYEAVVDAIMEGLSELRTDLGTPVADTIHRGDEYYAEGQQRYRPDIVFDQASGIHTSGAVGKGTVFDTPGRWAAENVPEGLFLAYGPDVSDAGEIDPISILDIAPTILYSMGGAIPEDFEGQPLAEVNTRSSTIEYREPLGDRRDGESVSVAADAEERLSDLGYLE
jgi:predicted AlkP superfamily phosphohydrolase/phosphomutase